MARVCAAVLAGVTLALLAGLSRDTARAEDAAGAPTIRLNWIEQSPNAYGWRRMTFRVESVTWARTGGWSLRVSIVNRSRQSIRIRTRDSDISYWRSSNFGIWGPGPVCDPVPYGRRCGHVQTEATRFWPRRPYGITLRPRQAWRGTFGGPELLRRNVRYYVGFGVFVPERGSPFSWYTQRKFRTR